MIPPPISTTMTAPKDKSALKEWTMSCVRLLKLMYTADKTIGFIILLCLFLDTVQEVPSVWVEAQTHTTLQQLLTQTAPKEIVLPRLIKLLIVKGVFALFTMGVQRFRTRSEAKIKKKLRIKLTIKLLKSFYNLDFVTQTDPMVVGDFQVAQQLYHGSILRTTNQVLDMLKSAAK